MKGGNGNFLDFDILKEPWNKFLLADGTILKVKFILQKIRLKRQEEGQIGAAFNQNLMAVTEVPDELYGPRGKSYSVKEIRANIVEPDIEFEPVVADPSIYQLADGKLMVVNTELQKVDRSSLYGLDGEPLYALESESQISIWVPPSMEPTSSPSAP